MSKPIKSTLELAMEKAAKLPELTREEIRERQEREYAPMGRAIAERFLTGDLAEKRLQVELFEREGEPGEIVRKAFAERMCQSIDLEDAEITTKVLEGARAIVGDEPLEETSRRLEELVRDCERQTQRELAEVEEAENARLRDLGISGSAIRVNPRASEGWPQRMGELQREFQPKLDAIRRELSDHLLRNAN
jgi:hypothetical protein